MKVRFSNTKMCTNGGMVPILKHLKARGIPDLVRTCLGERAKQSKYSHEDIITAWIATVYCHGFRLIRAENTKADLAILENMKLPSHDTVGRLMKKIATENIFTSAVTKQRGVKTYITSEHLQMNDMLIKGAIQIGKLKRGVSYTLDMDATMITNTSKQATKSYTYQYGFMPMVCMIEKCPIFISMRGANAGPHYKQLECLQNAIELLRKNGINVSRVRIDAAGYNHAIMDYLHEQNIRFVIAGRFSAKSKQVAAFNEWSKHNVQFSNKVIPVEATWRSFEMSQAKHAYRMVALRIHKNHHYVDAETNWKAINKYCYRFIITNDFEKKPIEIYEEYKYRGFIEQNFESLKNDFGWRIVPFSKINQNLVYLILTAFANNTYQGLLKTFSKKIKQVKNTLKLSTFRNLFIQITFTIENTTYVFFGGNEKIDLKKIM